MKKIIIPAKTDRPSVPPRSTTQQGSPRPRLGLRYNAEADADADADARDGV